MELSRWFPPGNSWPAIERRLQMHQVTNQPTNQSSSQSFTNLPTKHPTDRPANQSTTKSPTIHPTNQLTNQPASVLSNDRPTNQLTDQISNEQTTQRPINQRINQSSMAVGVAGAPECPLCCRPPFAHDGHRGGGWPPGWNLRREGEDSSHPG